MAPKNGTRGTHKKRPTDAEIADTLIRKKGLVSLAARALGMGRSTLYRRIEASETIREALHDARESMKDEAESALHDAIKKQEAWAVCFYLKTQAKDRGYVERQEHDHSGSLNVGNVEQLREEARRFGIAVPAEDEK